MLALPLALAAAPAHATNLVVNGGFETLTSGPGQLGYNTEATGWTTSGYNFVFAPGTADVGGSTGSYGAMSLWGSNNGGVNTIPASSPDGGNFLGADGAYEVGAITQTISGLVAGQQYAVSFWWAGAQQNGYNGVTTEQWQVSLGSETHATAVYTDASHGFSGWMQQSFTYTATASSEVLSFLAAGTPSGEPPFSLLDGVSLNVAVPEPASLSLLAVGIAALGGLHRYRRRNRS